MSLNRTRRLTRVASAVSALALVASLGAGSVLAGEITGNGKLKEVNGRSFCAFSGQEDLQWFTDDTDATLRSDPTRGDPGHAQSWGQIDQATRDFLTSIGQNPGLSCNPNRSTFGE
jgi:hypothetical protein